MNQQAVVKVQELRGIKEGTRVVVQDVQAHPPEWHKGRVASLWSDNSAAIVWDEPNYPARDRRLYDDFGHVDMHNVSALTS
ncbi:hypothetical protein [Burkholderia sp. Ac-20365]|uniref:hypothetical protein n=1 Tax=Burkholderia sp. Ac-20365 TaxID=2703897 RepID=UPI00197C3E66|nr:hypothetical protein [Burkholderia sp. Ac-20365]MBN3761033.1 hypothetical protein [Burkholderia sp. Ac-20365]